MLPLSFQYNVQDSLLAERFRYQLELYFFQGRQFFSEKHYLEAENSACMGLAFFKKLDTAITKNCEKQRFKLTLLLISALIKQSHEIDMILKIARDALCWATTPDVHYELVTLNEQLNVSAILLSFGDRAVEPSRKRIRYTKS